MFIYTRKFIFAFVVLVFISLSRASSVEYESVGFVTGDSFSNGSSDWQARTVFAQFYTTAIAGQKLVQMELTFQSQLDYHLETYDIDFAVLQGGVNDISSGSVSLQMMQTAVTNMIEIAQEMNVPLSVINVAPWNNSPKNSLRDEIEVYNSWLETTFGPEPSVTIIDIYSPMEDPENPQHMLPIYDYDGVHPNGLGYELIAEIVDFEVLNYFNANLRISMLPVSSLTALLLILTVIRYKVIG